MARTFLSFLKTSMIVLFLTVFYSNIHLAMGNSVQLAGGYMIVLVTGLLIIPLVIYMVMAIGSK